jgi:predicted 3-demethylubiquinone-9 3-methyltransferase (glyoxalase superfamily)
MGRSPDGERKAMSDVKTCLWFGGDGEEAAAFYVSIVPGSRIDHVQRSPGAWPGGKAGDVIVIDFTLGGQRFQALNGGTSADYGMAASISVQCHTQAEVDRLWAAFLSNGGSTMMCGWLRDRWGVPWQIIPEVLPRLLADPDPAVSARVFHAMTQMVKLDSDALQRAAVG